jgi:hypothetical protein
MRIKAQLHFAVDPKSAKAGIASISLDDAIFIGGFKVRSSVCAESIVVDQAKNGKEYAFSYEAESASVDELGRWLTLECEVEFTKPFIVNVQSYDGTRISFTPVVDKIVKPALTIAADDSSHKRQRRYSEEDLSYASKKRQETSAVPSSSSSSSSAFFVSKDMTHATSQIRPKEAKLLDCEIGAIHTIMSFCINKLCIYYHGSVEADDSYEYKQIAKVIMAARQHPVDPQFALESRSFKMGLQGEVVTTIQQELQALFYPNFRNLVYLEVFNTPCTITHIPDRLPEDYNAELASQIQEAAKGALQKTYKKHPQLQKLDSDILSAKGPSSFSQK